MQLKTIEWKNGRLRMLDQNRLPHREKYFTAHTANDVHEAIRQMRVRGAPLIGIAAAYGLYLASLEIRGNNAQSFLEKLKEKAGYLAVSRPTAVNLGWALERMMRRSAALTSIPNIRSVLLDEAKKIHQEDIETNRKIGENMLALLRDGMSILTHCNAGALATAGYGTALSALYLAKEKGWDMKVYIDETRPRLQGAMLTAWELMRTGIDVTLITDSMAAAVMSLKKVDAVLVGCDRMAANGDMANKVGTLGLSIAAKRFDVPFYVALPVSSID
ncbi:MAG: S-methyl-5-thioribose-1-phosphate isomerase, partial [Bacillota bacterium]|nr:S-methyl-5-thioribose-1-phosphate isomerase [Bacillota bacterium]